MGSLVRSFLGEAALRIQRLLELDAAVSPRFEAGEKIQPVIILGDGDRPGMGGVRGRRFSAAGGGVMAAGQGAVFRLDASAPGPLQLDRICIACSAVTRVQIQFHVGVAGGVTTGNTFWDRAVDREPVPGLFVASPVAGTGTVVGQWAVGAAAATIVLPLDCLLTPNIGIGIHTVSAVTLDCCLIGRSF